MGLPAQCHSRGEYARDEDGDGFYEVNTMEGLLLRSWLHRGISQEKHHQVRNLLVMGSGAFPTGAPANPTLTISALALRAADHQHGYGS